MIADENRQNWADAASAAESLDGLLTPLRRDKKETLRSAKKALSDFDSRREALLVVSLLDASFTAGLIDELLTVSLSDRDVVRVRNLLGRLSRVEAESIIPSAIFKLLEKEKSGYAYRRMAELLDHLGLDSALRTLCIRARDSLDEEVGEVAQDFGSNEESAASAPG